MSLRDQLLAKGLVSKKDARRVDRELKDQRKADQGARDRKSRVAAQEKAQADAEKAARTEERLAARKHAETERERHERAVQIRNLITGNRVKNTGPHAFFVRGRDGRSVVRLGVHRKVAEALRDGQLGVVVLDHGTRDEVVIVRGTAAARLRGLAPELVLAYAEGPVELGDGVYDRDWEPTIPSPGAAPRRV